MGAASSAPDREAVDRSGLSKEQYGALREALGAEDSARERVELQRFLARFPAELKPLVTPLFFRLGGERMGDSADAAWPNFVAGVAKLVSDSDWGTLLGAWSAEGDEPSETHAELAARLCFWCAVGADALGAPQLPDHMSGVLSGSRALQGDAGLLVLLRSMDTVLWDSDGWRPLYRNWHDGQSFNALVGGTLHYGGPALLLVRTVEGHLVGAVSSSWEDFNGKFGGGSDCFLFSVTPTLQVMRSSGRSENHMYTHFNTKNKYKPRGVGFGGREDMCRLWLDADFEQCHVLESDSTYQEGRLLPGDGYKLPLKIAYVEVWGCGGEEAATAQAEQRAIDQGLRDEIERPDLFTQEVVLQDTFAQGAFARDQRTEENGCESSRSAVGAPGADPELLIAALRPPGDCGGQAGALKAHLERAAPMLPCAVGARVASLLLGAPPPFT